MCWRDLGWKFAGHVSIQRKNIAQPEILRLRERLHIHETPEVLGSRRRSTHSFDAFGARHFQPHMALLRPGNGIDRDLKKLVRYSGMKSRA